MSTKEEWELQIADLNDTIELLTLDKEQLLLDKDILEEKCSALESQLEILKKNGTAGAAADSSAMSASMENLKQDNIQLRDALSNLREAYNKEKEKSEVEEMKSLELSVQVEELMLFKSNAESEMEELKQTVDSMSSFENLIEKLTNENMELQLQVKDYKQTITELEDAQELNEELDFQQRKQIESDKSIIQTLNVTITNYQNQLNDKVNTVLDLQRKLDQSREMNVNLRNEIEQLNTIMSSGFKESKEIEEKLKGYVNLQVTYDELSKSFEDILKEQSNCLIARHRLQASSTRLDALFGGTSYYIEESKVLNQEITTASAVSIALEASSVLSLCVEFLSSVEVLSGHMSGPILLQFMEVTLQCRLSTSILSVQLIAYYLSLVKGSDDQSGVTEARSVMLQNILSAKSLLELAQPRFAALLSMLRKCTSNVIVEDERAENDVLWQNESAALRTLMEQMKQLSSEFLGNTSGTVAFDKMLQIVVQDLLLNSNTATNSYFGLESLLLLSYTVVDSAIQEMSAQVTLEANNNSVIEMLKSAREVLLGTLAGLRKHATSLIVAKESLIKEFFLPLVASACDASSIDASSLRESMIVLRKLINSNLDSYVVQGGVAINLRYFPSCVLQVQRSKMNDVYIFKDVYQQHSSLVGKYWYLLYQGSNDLCAEIDKNLTDQSLIWKRRVTNQRANISERLNNASGTSVSQHSSDGLKSGEGSGKIVTASTVSKAKYDNLLHDLDVKSDALQSALNRIDELEKQLVEQMQKLSLMPQKTDEKVPGSSEVEKVKKEMQVLEEALQATEQKAENLAKELKLLKTGEKPAGAIEPSVSSGKALRRSTVSHHNISDVLATATSKADQTSGQIMASRSSNNLNSLPSTSNHQAVPSASYSALSNELDFWRSAAFNRMVQTLAPLPTVKRPSRAASSEQEIIAVESGDMKYRVEIKSYPDSDVKEEARRTYHSLRMQRVRAARVQSLSSPQSEAKESSHVRRKEREFWISILTQPLLS